MFPSIHPLFPISEQSPKKPRRSGTPFSYLLSNDGCKFFYRIYCPLGIFFWDGWFEGDHILDHGLRILLSGHALQVIVAKVNKYHINIIIYRYRDPISRSLPVAVTVGFVD